jgi:hypothetical protein
MVHFSAMPLHALRKSLPIFAMYRERISDFRTALNKFAKVWGAK